MQIKVRTLRDALVLLESLIDKKSKVETLKYILIKDGKAISTNLEIWAELDMPEAKEGILLGKEAIEFLKNVQGETLAIITQESKTVTIACGSSRATYETDNPDQFAVLPDKLPETNFTMDADKLIESLSLAVPYTSTDTQKIILQAVCLDLGTNQLTVAAADSFRLFYKQTQAKSGQQLRALIPAMSVSIMDHFFKKLPKPVADLAMDSLLADLALAKRLINLGFSDNYMVAQWGSLRLIIQLIQGTYPNYIQLIPTNPQTVTVYAPDMRQCLERVWSVAKEGSGIVRLEWDRTKMTVSAVQSEKTSKTELPVISLIGETEDGKNHIALNESYLRQYFRDNQGMIEMTVKNASSSIVLMNGKYVVVSMPMFVQWPGDPAPAPAPAPAATEPVAEVTEEEVEEEGEHPETTEEESLADPVAAEATE